jgi:hypothetical protein
VNRLDASLPFTEIDAPTTFEASPMSLATFEFHRTQSAAERYREVVGEDRCPPSARVVADWGSRDPPTTCLADFRPRRAASPWGRASLVFRGPN